MRKFDYSSLKEKNSCFEKRIVLMSFFRANLLFTIALSTSTR